MNASSIEMFGATVSADGTRGTTYSGSDRYRHFNPISQSLVLESVEGISIPRVHAALTIWRLKRETMHMCVCICSNGGGGGGSGGSILMEACNVSGSGLVSATGGPSRAGSGAGGGGRVSIRAGHVSSQLVVCPLLLSIVSDD